MFALDPKSSDVRIFVFRGGRAPKLGHNHVLSAPRFIGYAYVPDAGVAGARFDLEFRLDELEVDDAAIRAALGPAFASIPSPQDIRGTRSHMLGRDGLQADRFPWVRVHAVRIVGEAPKVAARVQLELHGQRRDRWVPLSVAVSPQSLKVRGSFVLSQTDFGIAPYSILGGFLAVRNEVVIEFSLRGRCLACGTDGTAPVPAR